MVHFDIEYEVPPLWQTEWPRNQYESCFLESRRLAG